MKIDRDKYLNHINDQEQIDNMKRIMDKIDIVLSYHGIESTDFLNPYERRLAISILNRFSEITYVEIGGLDNSERKIISIFPDYYDFKDDDIEIKAFEIYGYSSNLNHRDILGSLMSLGIIRDKIGDINLHDNKIDIIVKSEIADYIYYNLNKIAKANIKIRELPLEEIVEGNVEYKEIKKTISSMRLDIIISEALNISRNDSQKIINSNRVKVNWEPIDKVSVSINEGDMISIKGYGRFILYSVDGISRKGKNFITIRKLI